MSFLPSIRELQVRLQRIHPECTAVIDDLRDGADVIDRHAGDGDPMRQAAALMAELLATATHLNTWINQGAAAMPAPPAEAKKPSLAHLRTGFVSATPSTLGAPRKSADLPVPSDLLRRRDMAKACKISESYLATLVAKGKIEKPQTINHRTYWPQSAARAYLRAKTAAA